ncbi:uncharacterized protein EDB91DRAFT_1208174 [Suillus paluster]|uniref:uncharacterized protein n=1 Tax=Suillus paluster TaxID=48578 RepID=UPI001B886590|nr:uncharacterized protein EDB91DRAFT_1208174 [Suillus paluster]KAG1727646.1 hypothetical protein EDB91DRAFT_1208174 [Suillus paluster]
MQASIKPVQDTGVWEVLSSTWWEIRYGSINWSFDTQHSRVTKPVSHPKPPHYHGALLRTSRPRRRYKVLCKAKPYGPSQDPTSLPHNSDDEWPLSESLNLNFIGVKVAEEILRSYELDSGCTHSIMPEISLDELFTSRVELSVEIDEEEVEFARSQWAELARDLVGDIRLSRAISTSDLDVSRPQSSLSSLEYDSEPSTDSDTLPSTPTQRSAFSDVEVHQPSPVLDDRGLSPPKALNGSAQTFTPKSGLPSKFSSPLVSPSPDSSSRSSSSPTPVNFAFPAINGNYQYLPPGLKKDDQGFYTSVTPPGSARLDAARPASRLSSTRLPQFLSDAQSRKASKTRVIVDQMRATPVASKKGRPRNHSKSSSDTPLPSGPSASPNDAGDKKGSGSAKDHTTDPDPPLNPDNHVTPGRTGWKELPSPTPTVKALFPSSAARSSFPATPSFPDAAFIVQPHTQPGPFYPVPHAPGYPFTYVPARAAPPPPPPTSWVPLAAPAYPSGMYARPVVW